MIYLASPVHASPIRAVRQQRFEAACRAAAELIRQGKTVFSPDRPQPRASASYGVAARLAILAAARPPLPGGVRRGRRADARRLARERGRPGRDRHRPGVGQAGDVPSRGDQAEENSAIAE